MEFCHDFQNNRCSRNLCKFIHCSSDVEAEFKKSGYLPPAVRDQVISKGIAVDFPATTYNGVPICKDYLKVGLPVAKPCHDIACLGSVCPRYPM